MPLNSLMIASGGEGVAITYIGTGLETAPNSTTHTYSSVSLGDVSATRHIVIAITWQDNANLTLDTVTVGGVGATRIRRGFNSGNTRNAEIWIIKDTVNTSANIVLTFSGNCTRSSLGRYNLTGKSTWSEYDGAVDNAGDMNVNVDIPAGGNVVFACNFNSENTSINYTGVNEDDDYTYDSNSATAAYGHKLNVAEQTGYNVIGNWIDITGDEAGIVTVIS